MATITAKRGSSNHLDAIPSTKTLESRIATKAVLRKPVEAADLVWMTEDKLVLEEKRTKCRCSSSKANLVLEEKGTQVPMKPYKVTAGKEQPFHQSKGKEKLAVERLTSEIHSVKCICRLRGVIEKSKGVPPGSRAMSATVSSERKKTAISATVSAQKKKIGEKMLKKASSGANRPLPEIKRMVYIVEMDEDEYSNLEAFRLHTCTPKCRERYFYCQIKVGAAVSYFKEFMERTLGRMGPELVQGLHIGYMFFECYLSDEEVDILKGQENVKDIELQEEPRWIYC